MCIRDRIEIATASLSNLMQEHPEHRADARQDLQLLNAQKIGEHEAEIEKIKSMFLAILRDIKKDIDNGEQPGEAVTDVYKRQSFLVLLKPYKYPYQDIFAVIL